MSTMLLDVLVPAYENTQGLERLLEAYSSAPDTVRLVVFDDSKSQSVQEFLQKHPCFHRITYQRNIPSLGAIPNWNALLEFSTARYLMVLHHDEVPMDDDFFHQIVAEIHDGLDALHLDLWLPGVLPRTLRLHSSRRIRLLVLKYCPSYLLRRNLLGPPSTLVLKSRWRLPFDSEVPWLVDVDWYVRIVKQGSLRIRCAKKAALRGIENPVSITNSLRGTPDQRRIADSLTLIKKGNSTLLLKVNAKSNKALRVVAALESLLWYSFRLLDKAWLGLFRFKANPWAS
jgi:glycosyltransferase involved in cell wall biosynthesis